MDYHIFYVIAVTLVVTLHLQINPEATVGDDCIGDNNCTTTETCNADSSKCVCNSGSYESENACTAKKNLGSTCSNANECSAQDSSCTSNSCTCQDGFYGSGVDACSPKKNLGSNCSDANECSAQDSTCTSNSCTCHDGFYQSGVDTCSAQKNLGSTCSDANECSAQHSTCISNSCICQDGFYGSGVDACSPKKNLGSTCSDANECSAQESTCTSNSCTCQDGFYKSGVDTCSPKKNLGSNCSDANECSAQNSTCTSNSCTCQDGFYGSGVDMCSPKKGYGDLCDDDSQCDDEHSTIICLSTSTADEKRCLCKDDLYRPQSSCITYQNLLPILSTPDKDIESIIVKWNNTAVDNYNESYTVSTQDRSYNLGAEVRMHTISSLQNGTSYYVNVTHSLTRHGRTRRLTSTTETYTTLQKYSGACSLTITCESNTITCKSDRCLCKANNYWNGNKCAVDSKLAPTFGTIIPGTNSLNVAWTAKDTSHYHTYYRISWSGGGQGNAEIDSTQYEVTGLQQGTTYNISLVRVLGSYGRNRTLDPISVFYATKIGYDQPCQRNGTCFPDNTNCYGGTCRCNAMYFRQEQCVSIEILKPRNVTLSVNETTRAFLTWTSLDNPVVKDTDIILDPHMAGAHIAQTGKSAVISGLVPGKLYTANVTTVVRYMVGRTEKTKSVSSNTVRTVPARIKGTDSGTMLNAPNITISFKKADGEADYYIVRLTDEESYDKTNNHVYPGNDTNMAVMTMFYGVTPGVTYHLSITTVSGRLNSEEYTTNIRVRAKQAGPVNNLSASIVSSRAINVTWEKPENPNGDLYQYDLDVFNGSTCVKRVIFKCTDCKESSNETSETSDTHCTETWSENVTKNKFDSINYQVQGLFPNTTYTFKVTAFNEEGKGMLITRCADTNEEAAGEPTEFEMENKTSKSIKLKWTPPNPRPGITTYYITVLEREEDSNDYRPFGEQIDVQGYYNTSKNVTGLSSYWNYIFNINASTQEGSSEVVSSRIFTTEESAPTQVVDLEGSEVPGVYNKVRLSWKCPPQKDGRNGVIRSATVRYETDNGRKEVEPKAGNRTFKKTEGCVWNVTLDVTAEFNYTFTVYIKNSMEGAYSVISRYMPAGPAVVREEAVSEQQKAVSEKENSLPLSICPTCLLDGRNGFVESSGILICKNKCPSKRKKRAAKMKEHYEGVDNWQKASQKGFNDLYRATPSNWLSDIREQDNAVYEIGKNSSCDKADENGFCNGPLPVGSTFNVYVFVCTAAGCGESDPVPIKTKEPPSNIGVIVGAVCGVLAAVIIVIAVIAYLKLRKKSKPVEVEETANDEKELIQKKRPIVLSDFPEKVDQMHRDSNLLFSEEFEDISALSPKHNAVASETGSNKLKNRYVNILPFDHSRVKLRQLEDEDEESDYINANYIPGYRYVREYIATQGPMTGTINDFWRMIWEQKVPIIVMLSDLQEKGRPKVDRYYPENMEPVNYGDIRVEMTNFSPLSKYVIRIFKIELGDEVRTVRHYFLPGWQDFGANLTSDNVIDFIKSVRMEIKPNNTGPMCIHCSAGVGRTGTYITLDVFQQHIDEEVMDKELDIFDFVMKMRQNRSYMVQTEKQYIFIHDTIKEMVIRKKKEIAERDKNIYMNSGGDDELYVNQAFETDPCDIYMNVDTGTDKPTTAL